MSINLHVVIKQIGSAIIPVLNVGKKDRYFTWIPNLRYVNDVYKFGENGRFIGSRQSGEIMIGLYADVKRTTHHNSRFASEYAEIDHIPLDTIAKTPANRKLGKVITIPNIDGNDVRVDSHTIRLAQRFMSKFHFDKK